jgi:hypothetical protein
VLLEAINKNEDLEILELDDGYVVIGMILGGALVAALAVAYMIFIYKNKNLEETNALSYISHQKDGSHQKDEDEEGMTMSLIKPEDKLTTRNTSDIKVENSDFMNTNLIMTEKEVITAVKMEPMTNNPGKEEEEENETTVNKEPMTNNFEKGEEEEIEPRAGETDKIKIRKEDGCYEDLMSEIREEWRRRNNKLI